MDNLQSLLSKLVQLENKYPQFFATFYIVTSSLTFTMSGWISKDLTHISAAILIYFRSIFTLLFNRNFIKYDKQSTDVSSSLKLSFSGISLCGLGVTFNQSVKYIYMAESAILVNMSGIWVSLLSVYYLKTTKPSFTLFFAVALSFVGLVFLSRPQFLFNSSEENSFFSGDRLFGIFLALLSSFFSAAYFQFSKDIQKISQRLVIIQHQNIVCLTLTPFYGVITGIWFKLSFRDLYFILGFCVIQHISHLLVQKALGLGSTLKITIFAYSEVIFALIIDIIFFNAQIFASSIIGLILVISGFILLAFAERQ